MNISLACGRMGKACRQIDTAQMFIIDYCNNYARKLTGNDDFCFDSLPEEILVMISECDNNDKKHRWSYFIKMHVRKKLQELDFNV